MVMIWINTDQGFDVQVLECMMMMMMMMIV